MTKPAVCVSSSRTRIFGESSVGYFHPRSSGTYVSTGASSASLPSSLQLQDRQRRERLRHRRDAEERVGVDGTLRVDVLHAGALHVHQPAILHDAPHHAGNVRVEAVVLHRPIDLGEHRRVLGEHGLDEGTAHDRHGDRDSRDQGATGA